MLLSKPERNQVLAAITRAGLNPGDFEFHRLEDRDHVLRHDESQSFFRFGDVRRHLGGESQIEIDTRIEDGEVRRSAPRESEWDLFLTDWLGELKRDLETPDLWEQLSAEPQIAALLEEPAADEQNTPFSAMEQARIAEVLSEIKRQAADTYGLPEDELRSLNAKMDYLIEAARQGRRRDWLILALTVVSTPIVSGLLTPEVVHTVLTAFSAGLAPLFGHPAPMLGP